MLTEIVLGPATIAAIYLTSLVLGLTFRALIRIKTSELDKLILEVLEDAEQRGYGRPILFEGAGINAGPCSMRFRPLYDEVVKRARQRFPRKPRPGLARYSHRMYKLRRQVLVAAFYEAPNERGHKELSYIILRAGKSIPPERVIYLVRD